MWEYAKKTMIFCGKVMAICGVGVILLLNIRLYSTSLSSDSSVEIVQQLHFVKGELQRGMAEDMQLLFPEGYFFSYALYGLAWTNIAIANQGDITESARQEALWALSFLDTHKGRAAFPQEQSVAWGIFYKAWLNWLRGGILKLGDDPQLQEKFVADCEEIAHAFRNSSTPFLTSYTNASWPVDSVIGIAVLHLHDHLFGEKYSDVIAMWLQKAKKHCMDRLILFCKA